VGRQAGAAGRGSAYCPGPANRSTSAHHRLAHAPRPWGSGKLQRCCSSQCMGILTSCYAHPATPKTQERSKPARYLEGGATGRMIPVLNNVDNVAAIVQKAKFPPMGNRP
jgi:hypothetical protein